MIKSSSEWVTKIKTFYQPILKENTHGALNVSVVKIKGPDLNEEGNVVIAGHNYMRNILDILAYNAQNF